MGGNEVAWSNPFIITILPLSFAFFGVFLVVEAKYATEPILPLKLLTHRTPLAAAFVLSFSQKSLSVVKLVLINGGFRGHVQRSSLLSSRLESLGGKRRSATNSILDRCFGRFACLRDCNGQDGTLDS